MRSITQNIVIDRLQGALALRGVELKRSTVLEIAAETFGFMDGNAFVAAMKEGRFDPPVAEMLGTVWHDGRQLTVLQDPLHASVYALDVEALPEATRKVRFGLSPYGELLRMPDDQIAESDIPAPLPVTTTPPGPKHDKGDITFVVTADGHSNDPEVADWRHLLDDKHDIEVECKTLGHLEVTCDRMARVDGRLFFAFTFEQEYDSHEEGVAESIDHAAYVAEREPFFRRLGGSVRMTDDLRAGRIEVVALLPANVAKDVDNRTDWQDAVAILLGNRHEAVMATFGPQVWVKDDAHDQDPEGDVEFDVSVDLLLMGSAAAREIEDYRDSSDELQRSVLAPDWIYDWKGPFYVVVANQISDYLDDRAAAKEDAEPEGWSCDNCGETLQDGSGVCITCGLDHGGNADDDDGEDDNADDRPTDSVCDDCKQSIDYDTGVCTGCGRDWSNVEHQIDQGVLRTVLPEDADDVLKRPDIGDPV